MFCRSFRNSFFSALVLTIVTLSLVGVGEAQVRSSSNYQMQSDSVNVGGGLATSTSYGQESTVGEIATGPSDSTTYSLRAGYQQMQEVYLSLAVSGDVTMSPNLPGVTGGTSNGSSTFTVITDSPAGYQLAIQAENSPAMQSSVGTIADYDPGAAPSFSFPIASSEARFGFTPEGADVVQTFFEAGGICGLGSEKSFLTCWDGLETAPYTIAQGAGANHPSGATTTVYFRVRVGSSAGVMAGVYTATTTVTALPL